jgi:hypothetical protein
VADQFWKARIVAAGTGNLFLSHCGSGLGDLFPILNHFVSSFGKFVQAFTTFNCNFKQSYLLNNPALSIGIRNKAPLKFTDLEPVLEQLPHLSPRLTNIKLSDLIINEGKIPRRTFCANLGFVIPDNLWEKLDKIRSTALLRYNTGTRAGRPQESPEVFFNRWKKGSKKIRLFLEYKDIDFVPHNMIKYAENTETIIGCELAKTLNKSWNSYYYSNELRTFMFKLHNNTLPYNTILSHFVPNISRNCTFCDLLLNPEQEDENPLHLFFMCTPIETLREDFYKWLTDNDNFTVTRTEFFTTFKKPNNFLNRALFLVTQLFMKFVWNCKQREILPVQIHLRQNIILEVQTLVKISKEADMTFRNSNLNANFLEEALQG